jgi:hypothetical protein
VPNGVRAIQLRDTATDGGLTGDNAGAYRLDPIPQRYWAKPGDVLFRSRGDHNTATCLPSSFEPAVAVLPLVILRSRSEALEPAYLAWLINQAPAQRHFDSCAQGQNIRMISVRCLADLEIPLPGIQTQRAIAQLDSLARRECVLTHRLAERRQQIVTLALLEKAQRDTRNPEQPITRSTKEGRK